MRFVYQTRLKGLLEIPAIDDYTYFALKLAALSPGRTEFRGAVLREPFTGALNLIKKAGAGYVMRPNGLAVDGAADVRKAYAVIFADEIKLFKNVVKNTKENLAPDKDSAASGGGAGQEDEKPAEHTPETSAGQAEGREAGQAEDRQTATVTADAENADAENAGAENAGAENAGADGGPDQKRKEDEDFDANFARYIFGLDRLVLNGDATERILMAIAVGDIVYGNTQKIIMDLPLEHENLFGIYNDALSQMGGRVSLSDDTVCLVDGNCPIKSGVVMTPAGDWRMAVFGLTCSALGYGVSVSNTYPGSPFVKKKEFIDQLARMKLILREGFDGEAAFTGSEFKIPASVNAAEAGECLPFIAFLATQIEGNTEITNLTPEVIYMNGGAFYYTVAELKKLGAEFTPGAGGSMWIKGKTTFDGGARINCRGNFILSEVAILASLCSKRSNVLENSECLEKTYPDFWDIFAGIGGFAE